MPSGSSNGFLAISHRWTPARLRCEPIVSVVQLPSFNTALSYIELTIFDTHGVSRYNDSNRRPAVVLRLAGIEVGDRGELSMGSLDSRSFVRRARPILWTRDYEAAKGRLLTINTGADGDERFLALLSELTDYERRNPSVELARVVEWAECVFVPVLRVGSEPARRWSDGTA